MREAKERHEIQKAEFNKKLNEKLSQEDSSKNNLKLD
jgi:hypothetical protein